MKIATVTADVYSTIENVVYRIYVDNVLMTERTFIWKIKETYIRENIVIQVEEGTEHTVRVETCKIPGAVSIKNVTLDGKTVNSTFVVE